MRQWFAIVCLSLCVFAAVPPAGAATVVLINGVEIRNAEIVTETEHIVTVQIIGLTRVVLGKSEIDRIERTPTTRPVRQQPRRVVPEPVRPPSVPAVQEPLALPPPAETGAPAAPGMTQILKVAAEQPGVTLEFRVSISPETGLRYTVHPSDTPVPNGNRTYTVKAADGSVISVVVSWDSQGNITRTKLVPEVPPIDATQDEYEYTIETVGGGTFRIRAIWDVLNSDLIDINILLL